MSYTKEEVLAEFQKLFSGDKTRIQKKYEKRAYLMAILHYKFQMSEAEILTHTNLTAISSINHGKRAALRLFEDNDPIFLENIEVLLHKFPYNFPKSDILLKQKVNVQKKHKLTVTLNDRHMSILQKYMVKKKLANPDVAAQVILRSILGLWAE